MSSKSFPALEGKAWASTKRALHAYSKVVGAVPRTHAEFHPSWWHISLKVTSGGLTTDQLPLPAGGSFSVRMDLHRHLIVVANNSGESKSVSMTDELSPNQLAEKLFGFVAQFGLAGEYAAEKFESDEPMTGYSRAKAEKYFAAVTLADAVFKQHRETLSGKVGPVQLWPHGFDLAFEWFGTRVERFEEAGEVTEYPSQINLGFSPGEPSHPAPYFYSNPWPFEAEKLTVKPLPHGAIWFTDSWKGSLLEYSSLIGVDDADKKLGSYARAVYEISSPTLMA